MNNKTIKKTLVSIITVTFNSEKYLEDTILSVINQNYNNIEYIIIDGGSTDETLNIIKKYEDKISKWISEKDNGMYDAMNKGIKLANGSIIGIINSDDWYEKDSVENIVKIFEENKNIEIVHGFLRYIKNENELSVESINHEFLEERMIPHPTCFVKKEVYKKLNYYDINFKLASDYDFMLRAKNLGIIFCKIDKIITNFRVVGVSYNSKFIDIETLKIRKKYGIISLKTYFLKMFFYKIREFFKI